MKFIELVILFILSGAFDLQGQFTDSLKQKIQKICSSKNAIVGLSVMGSNGNDTISIHGTRHFPMQSVFKFHIALAVLDQIDKGKFSLNQKIKVEKKDLLPGFWSPLREENPNGGNFTIAKIIQYTICQSDNVGCDVLLNLIGGPKVVENYFKNLGFKDIAITYNEETMQSKWENMFENWTTPETASEMLKRFYYNKDGLLSKKSHAFLWKTLKATTTGANRLRGHLPKKTIVAHKTGSSGTNKEGMTEAVNDIGLIFLPNGNYFIVSVFVSHSTENEATNEKIIADIAKVVWDYYLVK